jgi:hypothetical protein
MNAYLDSLPRGLNSYPEYVMKAATYREFLAEIPEGGAAALRALPPTLLDLVERPLPVSTWLPEVHGNALSIAIGESFFASDDEFVARKLEANRRMLRGPLYRGLFFLLTPATMFKGFTARWEKFHKGIQLKALSVEKGNAKLRLESPHNLIPLLQARAYAAALQAALESAHAENVEVALSSWSSTSVNFDATWD